ncbi:MAG: metallophosphoesterase, partial [Pseudomonadota bacterium]
MRTLVHLSDLHFGKVDETLLAPLRELIIRLAPDVLVVSGDLTQRAKSEQFEQARAYLDTLPCPQIIVPGNHDISLYNVFRRFLQPLTRYKR